MSLELVLRPGLGKANEKEVGLCCPTIGGAAQLSLFLFLAVTRCSKPDVKSNSMEYLVKFTALPGAEGRARHYGKCHRAGEADQGMETHLENRVNREVESKMARLARLV